MSERLSLALLLCLTCLGVLSIGGLVFLDATGKPALGVLPVVASNVVLALVGLVSVWAQALRPGQVTQMQHSLDQAARLGDRIHDAVNGNHAALKAELAIAQGEIARLSGALGGPPAAARAPQPPHLAPGTDPDPPPA